MREPCCLQTLLAVLLVAGLLCFGCQRGPRLPPDPGLLAEDFGVGMHLGLTQSEAMSHQQFSGDVIVEVLAPEELVSREPFMEIGPDREMLLALYAPDSQGAVVIRSINCYTQESVAGLTLKGQKAAMLNPADVRQMYGKPLTEQKSGDGMTHLEYRFAHRNDRKQRISLTTMHNHLGNCVGIELALESSKQP